jgi:heat-inducible transcriptional repressor
MLDQRKLQILKLIIDDFIDSGQPVGSRTLAKNAALSVSPATIRNEMADLEELGYLYQPHTSAGRIPSDLGYRMYVDHLEKNSRISAKQRAMIRGLLLSGKIKPEEVVKKAAALMAQMTGMVIVAALPGFKKRHLENLKMIKISDNKVLLILVADNEVVKSTMLPFAGTNQEVLDMISSALLASLEGSTIEDIDVRKISTLKFRLRQYENIIDYLVPILRDTLMNIDDVDYHVAGYENIMVLSEKMNPERIRSMYRLLEDRSVLEKLVEEVDDEGIFIKIGEENLIKEFSQCTLITTGYRYRSYDLGRIAVIGPRRMDYQNVISVIEYIKNTLSDIFAGIYL